MRRIYRHSSALKLGAQPFAVGVLAAAFSAFPMVLSWQIGRLSDRFGSRWLLMFGAAGGMLVPYFVPGPPALYVAAAMNGLSFAFYNVSIQNLVGFLSNAENRTQNFSNYTLVISVTSFLGPLLSGFAIDRAGFAMTCVYIALLSLVPLAMLAIRGGVLPGGGRHEKKPGGFVKRWQRPASGGCWPCSGSTGCCPPRVARSPAPGAVVWRGNDRA